jgi:proteasome accessory factor C
MSSSRLGKRLRRIMLLVPYIIENPGVEVTELAARFATSVPEVIEDLELLFLCGLPGYGPGDLIDVDLDGDHVEIRMADYFATPLRITPAEALALYSGAAALLSLPGMEMADALRRGLTKLAAALGIDAADVSTVQVSVDPGPSRHIATLEDAIQQRRKVHLEYFSASRGEMTERDVDPWGLVAALGRVYLIAHDALSGAERMFRTDRVKDALLLEERAEVPPDFDPAAYKGAFKGEGNMSITLEVSPDVARWFEDYYPVVGSQALPDGWRAVELVSSGTSWAAALVVRLGEGVRNISPPEVVAAARGLASKLTEVHSYRRASLLPRRRAR